ncbi:integral membrane family protein [Seiridium cupressi]
MLKSFSMDDAVMIIALVMAVLSMVCFIGMVQHGAGRWEADMPDDWWAGLKFWSYLIGPFSTTGISLVKISAAFFLLRFMRQKWAQRFVVGMGIFCLVFMIYSIVTFMVACIPLSAFWNPQPGAKCWSADTLSLVGTVNGMVRMVYAYHRSDPGYTRNYGFLVWFNIELHAGILAASLPTLRPLFSRILKNTSRLRTYGYLQGTRYGGQSRSAHMRSGYRKQGDTPIALRDINDSSTYEAAIGMARTKALEDGTSEDGILPVMPGIWKRTEITVKST